MISTYNDDWDACTKVCCQLILEIMKILLQPTNGPSYPVMNKFHLLIMHIVKFSWLLLPSSLLLLLGMTKLWLPHLNPSASLSCFLINLSCRGIKPRFTPQGARHTTRLCGVPYFQYFVLWKNHAHYITWNMQ